MSDGDPKASRTCWVGSSLTTVTGFLKLDCGWMLAGALGLRCNQDPGLVLDDLLELGSLTGREQHGYGP